MEHISNKYCRAGTVLGPSLADKLIRLHKYSLKVKNTIDEFAFKVSFCLKYK